MNLNELPKIDLYHILNHSYDNFVSLYNEANAFIQLSWRMSDSVGDINALPELPVLLTLGSPQDEDSKLFIKNNYKHYAGYLGLVFTCAAVEQYFLEPYMALEITKKLHDGLISSDEIRRIESKIRLQSKHKNMWFKFRDESGINLQHGKYIDSILLIRNCIIHRHGLVDSRDLVKGKEGLLGIWLSHSLAIDGNAITKRNTVIEKGGDLQLSTKEVKFNWHPSQQIVLSLESILDINFTLCKAVMEAHNKIHSLIKFSFEGLKDR